MRKLETGNGKGGLKLALGSLLASVGISLSGCGESAAKDNTPNADNTPPAKEMVLASADEARVFASLSADVQAQIRAAYKECMAEVEEFARDGNENDPQSYQEDFDEGADDCDSIRKSDIGIANSEKGIKEITRSITSGT